MIDPRTSTAEKVVRLSGPALYWLVSFVLLPTLIMVVISFAQRGEKGTLVYTFSLAENYGRAFSAEYTGIYGRSIRLACETTLLCLLLGYPVAYYIGTKVTPKAQGPLLLLVVIPFWTSFLIRAYAWILILRTEGLVNSILGMLSRGAGSCGLEGLAGWLAPPWPLLYNEFAVLVGLVYSHLPFMILPLYASIQKLDPALLEAAQDLGASPAQAFRKVTLPLTMPGIVAGSTFVFIPALGAYIIPDLLGGSKSMMIGNLIQNQFQVTRDYPFGSALALLLTLVVVVVIAVTAPKREETR